MLQVRAVAVEMIAAVTHAPVKEGIDLFVML